MSRRSLGLRAVSFLAVLGLAAAACSSSNASPGSSCDTAANQPVITFAAYSTPREVYGKIIPAFVDQWKADHNGQSVIFQESYAGSTTQSQNIIGGFKADVFAASLAPDITAIQDAGLITHDWTQAPDKGMVSTSVVVFDVRPNNPLGIQDFNDLAKPGVGVLTPDPAASGGARWNIVAAYGAALRGYAGVQKDDTAGAQTLLQGIFHNVVALDKSARDSIKNFESGNGDVALTYENEVFTAQHAGLPDEAVYPPSTVLIENPVAVIDKNAKAHCVEDVANAFVQYLHTKEAKDLYTTVGFLRSTDFAAAQKGGGMFPKINDLFTVDDFGGWPSLDTKVFGTDGVFTKAFAASGQ
jgi:sulfate/thiosulfate transport system substrate-binding protein